MKRFSFALLGSAIFLALLVTPGMSQVCPGLFPAVSYTDGNTVNGISGSNIIPQISGASIVRYSPNFDFSQAAVVIQLSGSTTNYIYVWDGFLWHYICQGEAVCWTPDGQSLVVEYAGKLNKVDVSNPERPGRLRRLTRSTMRESEPALGSDGNLYFIGQAAGKNPTVFCLDARGRLRQVLSDSAWTSTVCYFGRLIYTRIVGSGPSVWVKDANEAGDGHQVAASGWDAVSDGLHIYYVNFTPDGYSIFRCRFDGSDITKVTSGYSTCPRTYWPTNGS